MLEFMAAVEKADSEHRSLTAPLWDQHLRLCADIDDDFEQATAPFRAVRDVAQSNENQRFRDVTAKIDAERERAHSEAFDKYMSACAARRGNK